MTNEYSKFNTTINDIEFKMLRKDDKCWIKVVPIIQNSAPSSLHIIVNREDHHWDIYDENRRDIHKVYFKGDKSTPSFYLISGEDCFRIDCNNDGFKVLPITENHQMDSYLKDYCNCSSLRASVWAIAIYSTNMSEKPPFSEM
jgi:hypothetical protein